MWARIKALRVLLPRKMAISWTNTIMGCGIIAVAVVAFYVGHWRASTHKAPQEQEFGLRPYFGASPASQPPDSRAAVARIFKNVPITRQELGEYLIERYGAEKIDFLVNRKIVEYACAKRGITISEAQIDAQLIEDLKAMNIVKLEDFVTVILKKVGKTLFEYKQDILLPKIALTELCKDKVEVTKQDIENAFEAKYGPKVQCRIIALDKEVAARDGAKIRQEVMKDEATFKQYAREKNAGPLAANGGEVPPIHKHFGDPKVEAEAFSLREGEVSSLISLPDGSAVILKCDRLIPADKKYNLENELPILRMEVAQRKLAEAIPKLFKEMRDDADPTIMLQHEKTNGAAAKRINTELMKAAAARNKIELPPPLPPLPELKKQ